MEAQVLGKEPEQGRENQCACVGAGHLEPHHRLGEVGAEVGGGLMKEAGIDGGAAHPDQKEAGPQGGAPQGLEQAYDAQDGDSQAQPDHFLVVEL